MENITKIELANALLDVRKAYRLIFAYQQRVLNTAQYVFDYFGLPIYGSWSLFSEDPAKNEKKPYGSAWRWLPMYNFELTYQITKENDASHAFGLAFQADTGWEDAVSGVSQEDISKFVSPESAKSKVYFYYGVNLWKPENFENAYWESETSDFFFEGNVADNKYFICQRFDMDELLDDSRINEVCLKFQEVCKTYNVHEIESKISA